MLPLHKMKAHIANHKRVFCMLNFKENLWKSAHETQSVGGLGAVQTQAWNDNVHLLCIFSEV